MKKALINVNIVMPDYMIRDGVVILDDDIIIDFGRNISTDGIETYDLKGCYVGPGLIDVHTHAASGVLFTEDPEKVAATLLSHGITDVLAALYFSATKDELLEQIRKIRNASLTGKAPNILGLYMEAPYMNPKFGCNRENNPWRFPINKDDYMSIIEEGGDFVKVWCLAPEREGIEGFVKDAKKSNPTVVFSVAHSEAEPHQIEPLMKYGLKLGTHTTNATGTIVKYPECRAACVDETVFYNNDIYAELICDKIGIHVDPYILRLIKKIKGDDKIILISDAFVDNGPIPPGYDGADDINFDFSGEISGSKMILNGACRNMMFHTGASLSQVFKYASTNPAKMLGLTDRGEIAIGKKANLLIVDAEFNIKNVIFNGEFIK